MVEVFRHMECFLRSQFNHTCDFVWPIEQPWHGPDYCDFHHKDKMVVRPSYLYNGDPYAVRRQLYNEMGPWFPGILSPETTQKLPRSEIVWISDNAVNDITTALCMFLNMLKFFMNGKDVRWNADNTRALPVIWLESVRTTCGEMVELHNPSYIKLHFATLKSC